MSAVESVLHSDGKASESSQTAVSWSAVFAGAVAASAFAILLITFGLGLGLSSVSPWSNSGASATTFAVSGAIWLIIVQWLSSAIGGYLAGRLRTKWVDVHTDEVFFRDTAHGLLAWSAATILTVALVASGASSIVGGGVKAVGTAVSSTLQGAAQGAAQSGGAGDATAYLVDTLFRSDKPDANANDARESATRILATSLRNGAMSPEDRTYLARVVAGKTGVSQQDAEKRVDTLVTQAKDAETKARAAADAARKTSVQIAFYTFFSMLIGAFVASVAGAIGGRQRDF